MSAPGAPIPTAAAAIGYRPCTSLWFQPIIFALRATPTVPRASPSPGATAYSESRPCSSEIGREHRPFDARLQSSRASRPRLFPSTIGQKRCPFSAESYRCFRLPVPQTLREQERSLHVAPPKPLGNWSRALPVSCGFQFSHASPPRTGCGTLRRTGAAPPRGHAPSISDWSETMSVRRTQTDSRRLRR